MKEGKFSDAAATYKEALTLTENQDKESWEKEQGKYGPKASAENFPEWASLNEAYMNRDVGKALFAQSAGTNLDRLMEAERPYMRALKVDAKFCNPIDAGHNPEHELDADAEGLANCANAAVEQIKKQLSAEDSKGADRKLDPIEGNQSPPYQSRDMYYYQGKGCP